MTIHIVGSFDKNTLCCTGSLTKFLTSFVCLSLLSEKYSLAAILDDPHFLDTLCHNQDAKNFLTLFQSLIGSQFSIHDLCSFYTGLPYTFDLSNEELEQVEQGLPFKHHSILDKKTFLTRCHQNITPVHRNQNKFHYSEISIIFLAHFIELAYDIQIEALYQKFLINPFKLTNSYFSRKIVENTFIQDLSDKYDYPAIGIADHGYFCYSNGFYTTLNDLKKIIENLLSNEIFNRMTDLRYARAASNRLMNGLTLEIRKVNDDLIYGYEGLSFSGCLLWAYSTKKQEGYVTFNNSEEDIYHVIYDQALGYSTFDIVPEHTQVIYKKFLTNYHDISIKKEIPMEYQGQYHRVNINEKILQDTFVVGSSFIVIRNPDEVKFDIVYVNNHYCVKGHDNVAGAKVGFYQSKNNRYYLFYEGNLYYKISSI